ncbi:MAG TPA: hypothetical protein VII44_04510 [Puia sp.]
MHIRKSIRTSIISAFFFLSGTLICVKLTAQAIDTRPLLIITDKITNLSRVITEAHPLETLSIVGAKGKTIQITDGQGNIYFKNTVQPVVDFMVGGILGRHTIYVADSKGNKKVLFTFNVDASTDIDDGGYYKNMFDLFNKGMEGNPADGSAISWNGKTYKYFVPWVLDHCQTMKGLKYFKSYGAEFVDLMRQAQRGDGMIYSFVQYMPNADYFLTRDKYSGYSKQIGDRVFVRQPTENHPEYLYVNSIYQCWQADGNDAWMEKNLESASKALNYTMNDPARWSKRFGLLKRVYTIDSWDFAVEDEYMPDIGLTNSMIIDPVKSKFGVFFGDNTGYITACYELAEMMEHAGKIREAGVYKSRGNDIRDRLNNLSWNGKYFTHFIDEDSTVKRHLGVNEKTQIAQSNAYSLNRNISPEQCSAIIETYINLKNNLPVGSPGEWYAIYPPFQKGFGKHNDIWQYMNGGVGGHVAGELARGAYANGYEKYGTDILNRLFELGKKYNNKIWFAYTGSIPLPPEPPVYKPLDITLYANMDNWSIGSKEALPWMNTSRDGDDLRNLPVGEQTFSGIRFNVIDAAKNNRKSAIAVAKMKGFPSSMEIPVNDTAACVYILHTSGKPASENVAGTIIFQYEDGSSKENYIINGKQLAYWWFSELKTDYSGIAWYGKNGVSEGVGISWCAINNPDPGKKIARLIILAPEGKSIYTVFAITLSNREHNVPVNPVSFGGPDNWAAATAMAALVEGLSGVNNMTGTQAFSSPVISPKWVTTNSDTINVTIRYAASMGYVAYQFIQDSAKKQIRLISTGNGKRFMYHILLPDKIDSVKSILLHGKSIPFSILKMENTRYADFKVSNNKPQKIIISY